MAPKTKYFPYLCKCMSFKHHGNLTEYSPRTTPLFAKAELVNVTPDDIVKYMSFNSRSRRSANKLEV